MKLTKEECRDKILELAKQTEGSVSIDLLKEHELYYEMLKYWKNLTEFKNEFGLLKNRLLMVRLIQEMNLLICYKSFVIKLELYQIHHFLNIIIKNILVHAACHSSLWYLVIERHISILISNRPFG